MRTALAIAAALLVSPALATPAHADRFGVVVVGDAWQPEATSATTSWLGGRGHAVVADAMPKEDVALLTDCFVIDDAGCARAIVDKSASADAIVHVRADAKGHGATVHVRVLRRGQAPVERHAECEACDGAKLATTIDGALVALVGGAPVARSSAAPADGGVRARGERAPGDRLAGFAIGAELGEPSSVTAGWSTGTFGLFAAVGSGTLAGPGLSARVDAQLVVTRLAPNVPLHVGLGGRFYHHGYEPMSIDELPHTHLGLRAAVGVGLDRGPMRLYAEVAPGLDLARSRSCTLANGPDTICPHAQTSPLFVHLVVGARWFLSH